MVDHSVLNFFDIQSVHNCICQQLANGDGCLSKCPDQFCANFWCNNPLRFFVPKDGAADLFCLCHVCFPKLGFESNSCSTCDSVNNHLFSCCIRHVSVRVKFFLNFVGKSLCGSVRCLNACKQSCIWDVGITWFVFNSLAVVARYRSTGSSTRNVLCSLPRIGTETFHLAVTESCKSGSLRARIPIRFGQGNAVVGGRRAGAIAM